MTIDLPYPVRITIEEHKHDGNCTPACYPVSESDTRPTDGACAADKAVADLALDLAYIDPNIKSCDQARVRVGAEFLLYPGESKEDAKEAFQRIFTTIARNSNAGGGIHEGITSMYEGF